MDKPTLTEDGENLFKTELMQLENLNNDKLRYVARMPRIPTPYARYINFHARVRINSSRYSYPPALWSPAPIHTPRWRETVWNKVSCLSRQHNDRD